eukprot:TRINITY_DN2754_c0_g1_i1.p1 TRINITY_DN2754_c0_g1~~TRINITY_DN2754_c0_g1_i1.p1  ORF type:complete len:210 (+),score=46.52 TRINITY_DN2754_c0_g1_i1:64-693(+)
MSKKVYKIIIIGDPGVGKTALMNQFVIKTFTQNYKTTIGADFLTKDTIIGGKLVTLQVWDTAGQERFHSLVSAFWRGADGIVLVFDVTNKESFERLSVWIKDFHDARGVGDEVGTVPFIIVGNKIDEPERSVSKKKAVDWCNLYYEENSKSITSLQFFECSAQDGTNVENAFRTLGEEILKQEQKDSKDTIDSTPLVLNDAATPSGCRC